MERSVIQFRSGDLVRLDVQINYDLATLIMACIIHRDSAQTIGRKLVTSL
jgi:translation elongation factor EF-4